MKSVTNFYASTLSFAYLPFKNYFLNKTPLTKKELIIGNILGTFCYAYIFFIPFTFLLKKDFFTFGILFFTLFPSLIYAFYLSNEEFKTEIKKKKLNQHSFIKNNTPEHDLYFSIKELEG